MKLAPTARLLLSLLRTDPDTMAGLVARAGVTLKTVRDSLHYMEALGLVTRSTATATKQPGRRGPAPAVWNVAQQATEAA